MTYEHEIDCIHWNREYSERLGLLQIWSEERTDCGSVVSSRRPPVVIDDFGIVATGNPEWRQMRAAPAATAAATSDSLVPRDPESAS